MLLAATCRTTAINRSIATHRSSQATTLCRPAALCARSTRPTGTPVRMSAQAAPGVGQTLQQLKNFVSKDILHLVDISAAKLFNLKDDAPVNADVLGPEDNQLCLQFATWAQASFQKETYMALARLNSNSDVKDKVIPESLVIMSGSSPLKETQYLFRTIETDTQALMGLMDDGKGGAELVVAFRGSISKADWITDFIIDMSPASELVPGLDPEMQVHGGFKQSANDFLSDNNKTMLYGPRDSDASDRDVISEYRKNNPNDQKLKNLPADVLEALDGLQPAQTLQEVASMLEQKYNSSKPVTKVVCCGHSLGGALATLTAYWCRKVGWPSTPVEYYSYGAPRVANEDFAAEWNQTMTSQPNVKLFRVMHLHDLVPATPRADLPIPDGKNKFKNHRYIHVEGGVLLLQPGIDEMQGNQGTPTYRPPLADQKLGYQAQRRRRPVSLDNSSPSDHTLEGGTNHKVGYIPGLKNALKNYTGPFSEATKVPIGKH